MPDDLPDVTLSTELNKNAPATVLQCLQIIRQHATQENVDAFVVSMSNQAITFLNQGLIS